MNLNTVLTAAITKEAMRATRKPLITLRSDIADLKRQVAELKRLLRAMQKDAKSAPTPESETAEPTRIRPTGPMVRKLRAKLGMTQAQFARLAGVSPLTISKWETAGGRIMLRRRTLVALAKVKGMGKGVESVRLNIEAIAKNEYELRQENAELQRLQADGYPAILSDILDAMSKQNPANWRTVNKEVIGIITEELPQ